MSIKVVGSKVYHESSGGFLFYEDPDTHQLYVALLQTSDSAVMIPKGHIEKGETPEQAAIRELCEELEITDDIHVMAKIGVDKYDFKLDNDKRDHQKKVHLFVLEAKDKLKLSPLRKEGFVAAEWYEFDDAKDKITFDKQNLFRARQLYYFNKKFTIYSKISDIKRIGIGLPTHNGELTLTKCLTSIKDAIKELPRHIQIEIVVCTDHCTDNTSRVVSDNLKDFDASTQIINNSGKKGKASALNLLFSTFSKDNDLIFFIDDDVELNKKCLIKMLESTADKDVNRFYFAEWERKVYKKRNFYRNFWYKVFGIKFDIQIYQKKSQLMRGACMLFRCEDYIKIPDELINDDQFFQYTYWPHTKEVEGAVTYFDSVDNFKDYRNRFLRIGLGLNQMEEQFSRDRVEECKKALFLNIDRTKINKLDTKTKFYFKTYRFIRFFVSKWVDYKLKKGEHNGWYRTRKS
jgi:8-oxo-dGTP pyrophosphatase MutT (NUDIX family)/glycosyltransferase involved in cell wall biosynthesis